MADDTAMPPWVPEVSPGLHADVYPVSPPHTAANPRPSQPAELRLDRHAVTHGYAERTLPFEFASCLFPVDRAPSSYSDSTASNAMTSAHVVKLRDGLSTLRRTRPNNLQRLQLALFASVPTEPLPSSSRKLFPLQKPSASQLLDDWMNKLAAPDSVSTSALSRSVPLGPAMVRAAGKVIEMMARHSVPTQRAAWYVRVAVLNECLKLMRPDRPPPSPRVFWTRQLNTLLRSEIEAIRARKPALPNAMDRVVFCRYLLDLVRWQTDESLIELSTWLRTIAEVLKTEMTTTQNFTASSTTIAIMAARRFLPEFVSTADNARLLCDAILPGAAFVVKAWRASLQAREPAKPGKTTPRKTPKRPSVRIPCRTEVTMLLSAVLHAIDSTMGPDPPEVGLSDLERFMKRGEDIMSMTKESKKSAKSAGRQSDPERPLQLSLAPLHRAMHECEKLPAHGDVSRVIAALKDAAKANEHLGLTPVKIVSRWAVEGPAYDRAEAISIAGAVLTALAEIYRAPLPSSPSKPARPISAAKRTKKTLHQPRVNTAVVSAPPSVTTTAATSEPTLQRELWQFLKEFCQDRELTELDKDASLARFLALLCRLDLLSLPSFVRDVSRLASCSQADAAYLVKCLSLLPDPSDKSIADCRRSLLRKFGYVSNARSNYTHGIEEKVVLATCGGDLAQMEVEAEAIMTNGNMNVILSTCEAVRLENIADLGEDSVTLGNNLNCIATFFLFVDEPGMAVEWLMENLAEVVDGDGPLRVDVNIPKRRELFSVLIHLVENLPRQLAASGQLQSVFVLLRNGYCATWTTSDLRFQILRCLSSMGSTFAARLENGSHHWAKIVTKCLRQSAELAKSSALVALASASLRGKHVTQSYEKSVPDLLDPSNESNWGPGFDEDLNLIHSLSDTHGTAVSELREMVTNAEYEIQLDVLLLKGLTPNDVFGCVITPLLVETLVEQTGGSLLESPFSKLANSVLQTIESQQNDVRLHGIRPSVVVDFLALVIAGCICQTLDSSESQDSLVRIAWFWKILAPRAGVGLAGRLRARVDLYCDKTGVTDKHELSATLSNILTRVTGETVQEEGEVSGSIGTEPFGMIEMQLALLAVHRRECEEDDEFGSRVGESAFVDPECAQSLTSIALKCCEFDNDYRQAMAGILGYGAVSSMAESISVLLQTVTVEASKATAYHPERAMQWYDADVARRTVLEYSIESLAEDVVTQVQANLFDQLISASSALSSASENGCLPSSFMESGMKISRALESRLKCILISQRKSHNPPCGDVWRQHSLHVAGLFKTAVPLLSESAINSSLKLLEVCIRNCTIGARAPDERGAILPSVTQVLEQPANRELKRQLQKNLVPTLHWVGGSEHETITALVANSGNQGVWGPSDVEAFKPDGELVDNWVLIEGYGRGHGEESSVPPRAFWRQGGEQGVEREAATTVQLKRTYSTYSSLAV